MTHNIPCADTGPTHDAHAGQPGHAAVVGTIDLPDGVTPTAEQLAGKFCEPCAVARGLQEPRPEMPAPATPDPPEEEGSTPRRLTPT